MIQWRIGKLHARRMIPVLLLVAVAVCYAAMRESPSVMTAATTRELPIYNVETQDKVIAISFDAAWGCANTEGIMKILDEYDVKTTFFLVGFWAEKYPELVAELAARGHEIGNHSATHPHMSQQSSAQIREELRRASDLVKSITGTPTTLFRPPYGEYDNHVILTAREEGYECVQWSVDSLDWKNLGKEDLVARAKKVKPGDIVLFHNDSKYILDALPELLAIYRDEGYRVVPVSELLLKGETTIDHAGKQHPAATSMPQQATQDASS